MKARKQSVGRKRQLLAGLLFVCLFAFAGGAALNGQDPPEKKESVSSVAPRGKKLVLKDGSFHIVRSYERKGERVRFYSVERSAWEEIPAGMVDWDATRKAETETEEQKQRLLEKLKADEMAARAREVDVDASVEVAPGIFLPDNEGLYVVEGNAILPLSQASADVKRDKGRLLTQILVPIPIIPSKHKIQVAGKQAILRITNPQPEFYFRTADGREPEVELIRAAVKGNVREIQVIYTDVAGQQATTQKNVSLQRWPVARGVYRLTLGEPLTPGEYALAEYITDKGMNLYVWDFGVDLPARKETNKK